MRWPNISGFLTRHLNCATRAEPVKPIEFWAAFQFAVLSFFICKNYFDFEQFDNDVQVR
jgi:hypothetical protein